MRGPAVLFRVVDFCLPRIEDGTDLDELLAAVGNPAARPLVTHLVTTLDRRGLVLHLDGLLVAEPEAGERERFPETLDYLETYREQPYRDFAAIRAAHMLLAGPAVALGPAARGLLRAGVGQLLVATPDPDHFRALASRHPEVRVVPWRQGAGITGLLQSFDPQAAVLLTEDEFPAEAVAQLPPGCRAIPGRLGKDVALVGPAIQPGVGWSGVEALWARAATWCRRDGEDLLVRPSGDLLAGALAGHVAFDALVGLNPGQLHVIHGPDLSADSLTGVPTGAAMMFDAPVELTDASPEPGAVGDWFEEASKPWSGVFRLTVPGELPQMPLALTLADGRSASFSGRAVGFGPDQAAATEAAALEGLRRHAATGREDSADLGAPASAAGVDEVEWLLDGALRLLARVAGEEEPVPWLGIADPEGRRLWRALEDYELVAAGVTCRRLRDFEWVLASVHDRRHGVVLGRAWGPDLERAAIAALSEAIALQQVRRGVDAGIDVPRGGPGLIRSLHDGYRGDLLAAVQAWLTLTGRRLRGRRLGADPIAGPLGAWCGTVWLDD
jgi:hypothetical protein